MRALILLFALSFSGLLIAHDKVNPLQERAIVPFPELKQYIHNTKPAVSISHFSADDGESICTDFCQNIKRLTTIDVRKLKNVCIASAVSILASVWLYTSAGSPDPLYYTVPAADGLLIYYALTRRDGANR